MTTTVAHLYLDADQFTDLLLLLRATNGHPDLSEDTDDPLVRLQRVMEARAILRAMGEEADASHRDDALPFAEAASQ